jgi:putative ABC transport system permease protein
MIRLLLIAVRNLGRNKLRTVLTVLGGAVAILAFVTLRTVLSAWNVAAEFAAKDRLGTRHKISFVMSCPSGTSTTSGRCRGLSRRRS